MSMYDGPLIDAFLHGPWIGRDESPRSVARADRSEWIGDPRLRRVMRTFKHVDGEDGQEAHMSVSDLLAAMAANGVERGIIVTKVYYSATQEAVTSLNRDFARMSVEGGGKLKWVASLVPPELGAASYWDVMQNTREIDGFIDDPNLCGVHITPSPWGILPNDRWFYPVYAKCVERRLPVFTYIGAPGPLWPMEPNNPAHLDDVALAFPDLTIVAHHLGDPWANLAIRLAVRHDNFYVCTSAWSPKSYPASLLAFLKSKFHGVWGCEKLIFASDFPLLSLDSVARDVRALDVAPQQLEKFVFSNAARLFWR